MSGKRRISKGKVGMSIVVTGMLVMTYGGIPVLAAEPPHCSLEIYGAEVSDVPRKGEFSDVNTGESLFAVHFPGAGYVGDWPDHDPPAELEIASSGGQVLEIQEPVEELYARHLHGYQSGEEIGSGSWQVVGWEESSAIEVLDPPEEALIVDGSAEVDIIESPMIRDTYVTRANQAEQALRIQVPIPEEWIDWEDSIERDTLFVVRFEVDEEPEKTPLEESDYVRKSDEGMIHAYDGRMSVCWDPITADWYEGETLHGLIWPLGMDPSTVSARIEVALEEHRQNVEAYYGPPADNGPGEDEGPDGDAETGDFESETNGCYSTPLNGGNSSIILLVFAALLGLSVIKKSDFNSKSFI